MGALSDAFEVFATDCMTLGLPSWRVDAVLREWRAPTGVLEQFASCEQVVEAIASIANAVHGDDRTVTVDWIAGVKLCLFREMVGRRKFGWIATILPTNGCGVAIAEAFPGLVAAELDSALENGVRTANTGSNIFELLWQSHERALGSAEDGQTIEEFTTQLTLAYESTVMISTIAQSMSQMSDPEEVIRGVVNELFMTLPFGWVGFFRADGQAVSRVLSSEYLVQFDPERFEAADIQNAAGVLLETFGDRKELLIESSPFGIDEKLGPELILDPIVIEDQTQGLLVLGAREGDEWAVSSYDTIPVRAVAASIKAFIEVVLAYRKQQDAFVGTLGGLSKALDAKDSYTRGHSERVAYLASELARAHGMSPAEVETVRVAGLVHDIGKIGVPEAVLCGNKKLTDDEFAMIKAHPVIGHDILGDIPWLERALPGVMYHHERWDGRGYPEGKAGDEIPLIARILGLVDAFDAMSSNRSYQTNQARASVLREIRDCRGTHFDPQLVDEFLSLNLAEYDRMLSAEESGARSAEEARSSDRAA